MCCNGKKVSPEWCLVSSTIFSEPKGHYSSPGRKNQASRENLVKFTWCYMITTGCYSISLFCYRIEYVSIKRLIKVIWRQGKLVEGRWRFYEALIILIPFKWPSCTGTNAHDGLQWTRKVFLVNSVLRELLRLKKGIWWWHKECEWWCQPCR